MKLLLNKNLGMYFLWPLLFGGVILLALAVRYPHLAKGHGDEVHTIGRSLNIIYTGDLNPHFFYHPTGTMYLCIGADILALAAMSREVGGNPRSGGLAPLDILRKEIPNPVLLSQFEGPVSPWWDRFRYHVRELFVLLIPLQIILLAYIGKRLKALPPALAAAFFLALSPESIYDSVYVAVNTSTGTFCLLAVAVGTFFVLIPSRITMAAWLFRLGVLGWIGGLAAACKYNAGTILLFPILLSFLTLPDRNFRVERCLAGFAVMLFGTILGFTTLCPYWFHELPIFIHDVLNQVWYFKVGHAEYNTFKPGLQMAYIIIRCMADQYAWIGLIATLCSGIYLWRAKWFQEPQNRITILIWLPALASCLGYLLLMSNQAVFFGRNLSIIWPSWFFCSTLSWWKAAEVWATKKGYSQPARIQNGFLSALVILCLVKAHWLDVILNPHREWWRAALFP